MPNYLRPMDDDDIVHFIQDEKAEADYDGTNALSYQREQNTRYYNGVEYPDGLAPTTGMSSIVINKVQPAVETLTTYLTNIFCSDKETVIFNPTNPNLGELASQTSALANHIIHKSNNGFDVISRLIKDTSINKNSFVKVSWCDKKTSFTETYENITEEELDVIISEKEAYGYEVEVVEEEQVQVALSTEQDDISLDLEKPLYTKFTIRCSHEVGLPKIENLPPEEFLINNDATSLNRDDNLTRFVCHRKLMYVGDVQLMFPELDVAELGVAASSDYLQFDYETQNRGDFDGTYSIHGPDRGVGDLKQVELTESWCKINVEGSEGELKWWHCFSVGNTLLSKEVWDGPIPIASFCMFPVPHKFYGLAIIDKIKDAMRAVTGLMRSEIDSAVQRNTFRLIADPRYLDQRDLQSGRPGIIKARNGFDPSTVMQIPPPMGNSGSTLAILQYLDDYIHSQLGIDPVSGAISVDVQKSGNDEAKTAMVEDNASAKVQMYAREFAEMTLRPVIWNIVWLLIQHKDDVSVKKLVDEVTPGVPFLMGEEGMENALRMSDLSAKVGLGHLTSRQKLQGALAIKQEQMAIKQLGVVIPPAKEVAVSAEIAKAVGFENYDDFFPTKEEIVQSNQWIQQALQEAIQMGQQQGMQQAMQQAQTQEVLAKVQKLQAEIDNINAKTESERTDQEVERREIAVREREQALQELLAMSPNATQTVTAIV